MARAWTALWLAACLVACGDRAERGAAPAPSPPLISRADFFSDPVRSGALLSPRGDRVAFLAPRDGVLNLWVVSVGAVEEARPVTDERDHGVRNFYWAQDNSTLLYLQEGENGETARLFAVAQSGGAPRALTPAGMRAEVLGLSASDPEGVVVSLNQRDPDWPDVFRVDIASGARTLLVRNPSMDGFSRFVLDQGGNVRLGVRPLANGGAEIASLSLEGTWTTLLTAPFEDAMSSQPIAFEADGRSFTMLDSTGRDRTALVRVDALTGVKSLIGESARSDVVDVWLDPISNAPEAFATDYLRREWRALDPDAQADLDFLDSQLGADFRVVSRSAEDARWLVVEEGPTTPARTYLYDRSDRAARRLTLMFRHRPALEGAPLQPMTPVEIESRDGLTLVSYLTLPIGSDADNDGRPDQPAPLVIVQQTGPWARASFGFDALHQWLSNRGYAVLSVNTRGSSGFGKAFLNAGNHEWGGRVQADVLDAARWAVENNVAQEERIAIVGSGFGGYAALAGLAFAPEQFRCGASFSGFVNLATLVETAPPAQRAVANLRVGDPRTNEGRQTLRAQSPLFRAGRIAAPLLLAVGGQDDRFVRAETDQLAQAVRARRGALTYLVFNGERQSLAKPQNRLSYYAVLEHFLGACVGGRVEPVGTAFDGGDFVVNDGALTVPGLRAFARRLPRPSLAVEPAPPSHEVGAAAPEPEAPPSGEAPQN